MNSQNKYRVIKYQDYNGQECQIRPSEEQLKVILSDLNEDQKIIACAGSGKTTTLVIRLKYLIDQGVAPEQILVTTYNVDAGKNLKKKAREIIGCESCKIEIGNIDKVAFKIYQKSILSSQKQLSNLKSSVKEFCNKLYQFLQTPNGEQQVLSKYKYFFFDEFQDVNQLQYDILILFKKKGCNITVIGDDAQNIYGFRDSKLELIQHQIDQDVLKITNKKIHEYQLSLNYRCSKPITEFSNQIIANSNYLIQKQMKYNTQKNYQKSQQPQIKLYNSWEHQVNSIIYQIKQLLATHLLSEIAVLSPTNHQLRLFEEKLEKNNKELINGQIPFIFRSQRIKEFYQGNDDTMSDTEPKLTLSTLHQAKGLEWKIVFFIGINDQYFPGEFINQKSLKVQQLEECRRLFYVGCTRAINQLNFSVLQRKQKDTYPIVCRFFSEIDQKYFKVDEKIQKQDFAPIKGQDDIRPKGLENQTQITKIIEEFEYHDFEKIDKYLQNIQFLKKEDIHKKPSFDIKQIVKNRLSVDLGIYIDILFQRIIAEKYNYVHGYTYSDAQKVLFAINWANQRAEIVFKYKQFFENKNLNFTLIEESDEFVDVIQMFYIEKSMEIIKFEEGEIKVLKQIYEELKKFMDKNKLDYSNISHLLIEGNNDRVPSFFPDDFDDKHIYIESYKKYCNSNFKTMDILEDIYNVSKCGLLINLIRRSLYRNDFKLFNPIDLKIIIDKFLDFIKKQNFKNIQVKKNVKDDKLIGEIDFIADNTIFEIKSSSSYEVQKEYIIQCLAYASLMKKQGEKINSIAFYNPLQGYVSFYDISDWKLENEFCDFLFQTSLNKIKEKQQQQQSQNFTNKPQINQNEQSINEEKEDSQDCIEIQNEELSEEFNKQHYIDQLKQYVKVDNQSSDIELIEISEHKFNENIAREYQKQHFMQKISNEKEQIYSEQPLFINSNQNQKNQLQHNKCEQDTNQRDFETEQKYQKTHQKICCIQSEFSDTESNYSCSQSQNNLLQPSSLKITPIKSSQEIQSENIMIEEDLGQDFFIQNNNFYQTALDKMKNVKGIQQQLFEQQNQSQIIQKDAQSVEQLSHKINDKCQPINQQNQNIFELQNNLSKTPIVKFNNEIDQNLIIHQNQSISLSNSIIIQNEKSFNEELNLYSQNYNNQLSIESSSTEKEQTQNHEQIIYQSKQDHQQSADLILTLQQNSNPLTISKIDFIQENNFDLQQKINNIPQKRKTIEVDSETQKQFLQVEDEIKNQANENQHTFQENQCEKNQRTNFVYNQITFSQLFNHQDDDKNEKIQQGAQDDKKLESDMKDPNFQIDSLIFSDNQIQIQENSLKYSLSIQSSNSDQPNQSQQEQQTYFLKQKQDNYQQEPPDSQQEFKDQNCEKQVLKCQFQSKEIRNNADIQQQKSNLKIESFLDANQLNISPKFKVQQNYHSQNSLNQDIYSNNKQQQITKNIFQDHEIDSRNQQSLHKFDINGYTPQMQKSNSENNRKYITNFKKNNLIQKNLNKTNTNLDDQNQLNNIPLFNHKNKGYQQIKNYQSKIFKTKKADNLDFQQQNDIFLYKKQVNNANYLSSHVTDSIQSLQKHHLKNQIIEYDKDIEEIVTSKYLDEISNQNDGNINLSENNEPQQQISQSMKNNKNHNITKLNSKRKVSETLNKQEMEFQQETHKKIQIQPNYDISHAQIKFFKDILILLTLIWFSFLIFKNKQFQ
ncbi:hypothetical protein ABPG72_021048 [Tetrahymena utriculariae]